MITFCGTIDADIIYYRSLLVTRRIYKLLYILLAVAISCAVIFAVFELEPMIAAMCVWGCPILLICFMFRRPERQSPYKDNSLTINIDGSTIVMDKGEIKVKENIASIIKVIDYGSWYCLYQNKDARLSIICQKDLLVEGTLDEFEQLFAGKIVKGEMI